MSLTCITAMMLVTALYPRPVGCVDPTNSAPKRSLTNSAPNQNTGTNNSHQIAKDVVARAATVIGSLATRLIN